jgi:type II secretory pathway pseudopilin PulG
VEGARIGERIAEVSAMMIMLGNSFERNRLRRPASDRRGISLSELLIAIAVLLIALAPILSMFRYSTQASVKTLDAIQAVKLATLTVEQLRFSGLSPVGRNTATITSFAHNGTNEFSRLAFLISESSEGQSTFKKFTCSEGYDAIPGYPGFKREIEVGFFPEPEISLTTLGEIMTGVNPGAGASYNQYKRLMSRIKIKVTITYKDTSTSREHSYSIVSIVVNKS